MMNSRSSTNQPVYESEIDWESWINELKADDDFDFDFFVTYSEDTTTINLDSQSQPIIPTIDDGIKLRGDSANQSPGGINQEMMTLSSFTPSNSMATLHISGPVLSAAAPKFVSNHVVQSCQSGRITDFPRYHPVQQNIPLHQQQVHSIMNQSNLFFGQQKNHLDSQMPSDQLHTGTRPMLDMQTGNLSYHQASRKLHNANHNPSKIHLQAQQKTWTSHNLITGGRQQGNNSNTNLSAPLGFATPQEFPSSDAWHKYAFRQIRKMKETYLNDLMKMHINATCLCSQATNLEAANEYRKVKTYLERMLAFLNTSNVELIKKNNENVYSYMTLIVNYLHHFRNKHGDSGQNHEQFNQSPKPSPEVTKLDSKMDIFNHIISSTRPYKPRGSMPISVNNSSFQMGIEKKSANPPRMHSGTKINVVNVHQLAVANQKFSLEKMKQPMHITSDPKKSRKPPGTSPLGFGLLDKCPSPHFSIPSSVKPISLPTTSPQCSPLSVSSPRFDANHALTPELIARSPFILGRSPPEKQSTSNSSGLPTVESQELETPMNPPGKGKSQEPQNLEDQHHHLMEVVESISSKALGSSLTYIHSVEGVIDSIPDYEAANILGPYEDNEANFILEGDNEPQQIKKRKLSVSSGYYDQFLFNEWDIDSTETSTNKRQKTENSYGTIFEEIKEINNKLVETSLHLLLGPCEDYISTTGGHSETKVKCVYKNVCVPELVGPPGVVYSDKTREFFIQLLVPADYPASSPKIWRSGLNVLTEPLRKLYDEMLSRFDLSLSELPGKMSLGDMAQKWESCARAVMLQYVRKKEENT